MSRECTCSPFQIPSTTVFSYVHRFLRVVPAAALAILFFILLFNASHGFDITDESFYLLWASQPERVLATVTQFGHYTNLLYLLSGENITAFRITGILLLLGVTTLFFISLERYWMGLLGAKISLRIRLQVLILIFAGTLAYYDSWLLTPSYNWLALISVLLPAIGLLHLTTKESGDHNQRRPNLWLFMDGLLVGGGSGIAFMAKPTTAFLLVATTLYWITTHSMCGRWKPFLGIALLSGCTVLLLHTMIFSGGIVPFYVELREGLNLNKILGAGHSVKAVSLQAIIAIKQIPVRVFTLAPLGFLLSPFIWWAVWWNQRQGRKKIASHILALFLLLFFLYTCYQLWKTGQWSRNTMGFSGLSILLVLLSSAALTLLAFKRKVAETERIPFLRLVGLCFFLFMLAGAVAFGSASGLIRKMSMAYIFLTAGALYTAFWIDQFINRNVLAHIVPTFIAVSVLLVFIDAYNKPYRLPEKISEQRVESTFFSNSGSLYVDKQTANYIRDLKMVAKDGGWTVGTPLIDLTGGSPGATVILAGRITGVPWLVGSYKGSHEFVKAVLMMVPKSEQRSAWILTAPNGKRKVSDEILMEIGLGFPGNYMAVGKVKTGHRDELQILWKPLNVPEIAAQLTKR